VNPAAGRAGLLAEQLPAIESLLEGHGFRVEVVATTESRDSARELASIAAGMSSVVVACGGDGTVHGVIQGLARTPAALGILPLGTANALARNLQIPLDPLSAMARLLTYEPRLIPLGEMQTASRTGLFAVMAGCGPDGALVHALTEGGGAELKSRFGRQAYYAHAVRLFLTRRWPGFEVEMRRSGSGEWTRVRAVAVMASRVPDLGGLFSGLTPLASLTSARLRVHVLKAPSQVSFPAWFVLSRLGLPNRWLTTLDVEELRCTPVGDGGAPVFGQADAEAMGAIPMTLRVVPDALWLLMPVGPV
jgi:diacylglycerol kinase family enzyme